VRAFLLALSGKMRRAFLCLFRPSEVREAKKSREGECDMCGNCCRIAFDCPFLKVFETHSLCRIYHIGRPVPCQAFPIDQRDIDDVGGACSFSFSEPSKPRRLSSNDLPVWNRQPAVYSREAELEDS